MDMEVRTSLSKSQLNVRIFLPRPNHLVGTAFIILTSVYILQNLSNMSPEMLEIESALLTHQYIQSERKLLLRCIPTKLAFFLFG
jgi:hypothetical protein